MQVVGDHLGFNVHILIVSVVLCELSQLGSEPFVHEQRVRGSLVLKIEHLSKQVCHCGTTVWLYERTAAIHCAEGQLTLRAKWL